MKILEKAEIEPTTKSDDLTEAENSRLREIIDREYRTEGELRKEVTLNVKRLIDIGSYRGLRHRRNLPAHGQRTRTNARTRKGIKKTVAGRGQKRGMAKT
jgi:small subunit ribosomal protein S13